ncbi:MAG: MmgE/PrpD family protein, partial [Desulfobacterales bacterium]|nr:MmgE/PrpD family protein [Desulfobacterales bacterium]
ITGSREFLTGKYGFYALYENNDYNPEAIIKELGSHHPILDLSIKPYPACRMTHSSIDAALELRPHLRDRLNEIESMEVTASAMVAQMVGKPFEPGNNPQVDAQFSIPYTVATALKKGEIFLEDFQSEQIFNTEIQSLARRVQVKADPHLPAKDLFNAHLEIILKSGETRGMNITVPLGNPANPMNMDMCRHKFQRCIRFSGLDFPADQQSRLLNFIQELDQVESVTPLMEMMCP